MNGEGFDELDHSGAPEASYEVCDVDSAHPQWSEVRPGVNYVAPWRTARRAAARLRCALERTGSVALDQRSAFARVRGDGSAVVCLELELPAAAALAVLIEEALRERAEGAPKIRGTPSRHVA